MKCKILKSLGTLSESTRGKIKLQLISWDGRPAIYDLRLWESDVKAKSGITLTKEELLRIVELFENTEEETSETPIEEDDDEVVLDFTKPITKPVEKKTTKKVEKKAIKETPKKETKKENIIKFPKPKKEIEAAKTTGNHTYAECEKKLDKLFEKVKEVGEYQYVLMGLKEMAKVDKQFVQNAMREDRTFEGMLMYLNHNANDNCTIVGSVGVMTDDTALALCIDYFNAKEA